MPVAQTNDVMMRARANRVAAGAYSLKQMPQTARLLCWVIVTAAFALGSYPESAAAQEPESNPTKGSGAPTKDAAPDGAGPDDASPDDASPDDASPDGAGPDGASPDGAGPDDASAKKSAAETADSNSASCAAARAEGVAHQQQGHVVAAKVAFRRCATAACPNTLADSCTALFGEASSAIASVVLLATNPSAKPTQQVQVFRGDQLLLDQLTDAPLELDPGRHTLRFELAGAPVVEQTVVLKVGEKRKPVSVIFRAMSGTLLPQPALPAKPADVDALSSGSSAVVWIGVALGGVGLATGLLAGTVALVRRGNIHDKCDEQMCTEDDIAAGEIPAHVATAGFALAGVGAATALIGFLVQPNEPAAITVAPLVGPGFVGIHGNF